MSMKKKKNEESEIEDEDDSIFQDDADSDYGYDEALDNDDSKEDKFFDETYDDFETGLRNQPDVYRIWLDTDPYIRNLYLNLTNQIIKKIKYIKNGKTYYKTKIVPISYKDKNGIIITLTPLANELGISQIMGNLKAFVSSPLVQANLDKEQYHKQMLWYSEKLVISLWTNRINWNIHIHNIQQIHTMVIGSVEIFLTRTIGNLERSRERVNPNVNPLPSQATGLLDKIAFWKKQNDGRA